MNYETYHIAKRDLRKYSTDNLSLIAKHLAVDDKGKEGMIRGILDRLYIQGAGMAQTVRTAEMSTDTQAFRKVGLTRYEYRKLDDMMTELSKALNKYKVRYWMDGGTMLGSIRHRGMIPWDDDVDIGVLEEDEDKLHKALKSLADKYDIEWDLDTDPICRRVVISARTKTEFPFAEFFIYKLKKGRTRFRCAEDEEGWGEKCYHELKHLFPLRDYPYGKTKLKGPYNPIPYFNRCYGSDWNDTAYREQSHKGGFYYDDRRVKVTKFDHVGGENDTHVYNPKTRKWVKKGSAEHKKLIKEGYYTAKSKKRLFNVS